MTTGRAPHLKLCPASGEGVHKWLYYAACRCVEAGLTNDEAEEIIEDMMTRDPNPPSEIMMRCAQHVANAQSGLRDGHRRMPLKLPK